MLHRTLHHVLDPAVLLSRGGRVLHANPAVARVLGPDAGASGTSAARRLHPDDLARVHRGLAALPPEGTVPLPTFRLRRADGTWATFAGQATCLRHDPEVRGVLVQLHPVRRADAFRHGLEDLSRDLASAHSEREATRSILRHILNATGAVAGSVTRLSDDGEHLDLVGHEGYAEGAVDRWSRLPLALPAPITDAVRRRRAVYLDARTFAARYPQMHAAHNRRLRSAAVLPLRLRGRVLGAIALSFARDRTFSPDERAFLLTVANQCATALERFRLQGELRRERDWQDATARLSADVVTVLDARGVIRYESPSVERVLGYAPGELAARLLGECVHAEDLDEVRRTFRAVREGGAPASVTYRFRHLDGRRLWLESHLANFLAHPDIRGLLANTRDVTARVEAHEARGAALAALALREEHFRLLAENATDLVRRYDLDGAVTYASPAARDLLGYDPHELLGPDPLGFVHPDDLPALRAAFERRFTPDFEREKFEYRARRKDGRPVWVETTFKAARDPVSGEIVAFHGTTRDIESRKRAELELQAQVRRYRHLLEFTVTLEHLQDPVDLVQETLRQVVSLTEFEGARAFDAGGDTDAPAPELGVPGPWSGGEAWNLRAVPLAPALRRALRRHEPCFVAPDEPLRDPPEPLPREGWRAVALVPVTRHGQAAGVLAFGAPGDRPVTEETRRLLEGVAVRLGHALERRHHLEQLRVSREETLRALGLALEYRDYESKGHTDRVVGLTERLARALRLDGPDLDALRWGAYLHDTGKVAIPDAILLKPAKLDPEEFDVIRRHPTIGYEMLVHIPTLPPATLEIVLHHHEKWDGSGYPSRLAGADIPLAARIFALVDVYDALTSERPYKRAWSHEEALAEIGRTAGTHFDPALADVFVRLVGTGERADA